MFFKTGNHVKNSIHLIHHVTSCRLVVFIIVLFAIPNVLAAANFRDQKLYTSSAFGPEGRLWRIVPDQQFVAVDYSDNFGKTFSKPVRINKIPQKINLWSENPPAIAVDMKNRIYVLYFADSVKPYTSFFSQSTDGIHFSQPVKVSTMADSFVHFQSEMLVDKTGKVHIFWHDQRDKTEYKKQGGGDLSLFYVAIDGTKQLPKKDHFPRDQRIAKNICSCCRTAVALDTDNQPVVLARFVYPDHIRDLGMLKIIDGNSSEAWRVTYDNWKIEGCPTHGPALSISNNGRYHMTWFTQGSQRTGLFYSWSDDQGKSFSTPMAIGDLDKLAGHADVLALDQKVALVWKQFNGVKSEIRSMHSDNGGQTWSKPTLVVESSTEIQHPALITDGRHIFLSLKTADSEYRLIPVE
jgi:hypothetical protein